MPVTAPLSLAHRPAFKLALLQPRYWPTWAGLGVLLLCSLLPWKARAWLGDRLTPVLLRADSKRKRIARRNLSLCFPEMDEADRDALLRRHVRALMHLVLSYGVLLWGPYGRLERRFEVSGLARLRAAAGGGVILLTPHSIAMEFLAQWITRQADVVAVARLHSEHALMDWLVSRTRVRFGGAFMSHLDPVVTLVRAVRGGHWLFHLPDEDLGDGSGRFAPFFGIPKATNSSLGRLARLCRAPVVPLRVVYCPDRQRFQVDFGAPLAGLPSNSPETDATLTNAAIEALLRPDPAQYVWYTKIFRSRPDGMAGVYD
jgi:lauroyl-KDO2-lipid IV(A) myristoyltransferase